MTNPRTNATTSSIVASASGAQHPPSTTTVNPQQNAASSTSLNTRTSGTTSAPRQALRIPTQRLRVNGQRVNIDTAAQVFDGLTRTERSWVTNTLSSLKARGSRLGYGQDPSDSTRNVLTARVREARSTIDQGTDVSAIVSNDRIVSCTLTNVATGMAVKAPASPQQPVVVTQPRPPVVTQPRPPVVTQPVTTIPPFVTQPQAPRRHPQGLQPPQAGMFPDCKTRLTSTTQRRDEWQHDGLIDAYKQQNNGSDQGFADALLVAVNNAAATNAMSYADARPNKCPGWSCDLNLWGKSFQVAVLYFDASMTAIRDMRPVLPGSTAMTVTARMRNNRTT